MSAANREPDGAAPGDAMQAVAELAAQLQDVADEDRVYALLGHGLHQLVGEGAIVAVSALEPSQGTYSPKALLGLGRYMDGLLKLLGKRPEDLTGDYTPSVKQAMASGRLTRVEGGVAELARLALPPAVCRAISTLLGLDEVHVVGFRRGSTGGGVSLITSAGLSLPAAPIEAMTMLCAVALSRLRTLRASEEKYRRLVENIQDILYSLSADGRFLFVSPAWTRVLGHPLAQVEGRSFTQFVHPDDQAGCFAFLEKVLRTGQRQEGVEYRVRHADGTWRWHTSSASPVRDASGAVTHYDGIARDISERKQAEQEARRSNHFLASLLQAVPVCVFYKDRDGRYLGCNGRFSEVMGVTEEQIRGKTVHELWPSELADKYHQMDLELMRTRGHQEYEFRVKDKDGRVRPVIYAKNAFLDASGEVAGLVGAFLDITERKQAEAALKENEERFRLLHNLSTDLILLYRVDGGRPGLIVEANDAAHRRYGYAREEMLRMTPLDLAAPEGLASETQATSRLLAERQATWEGAHRAKDGRSVPVETAAVLFEHKGERLVLSSSRDITERRRAEEEKAKLQTQLLQAQKMESVGRLAGGVAHDFNNMLGVILGHTELALDEVDPALPLHADLQEIRKAATRSAALTRQLLAFARKQTVAPKVLDLNETVDGMLKMLRRIIGEDIHLAWRPGPDAGLVKIDPSQVDQVLANLCVNARDAIAGTGKLTIETGAAFFDEERCALHPGSLPGEYVLLAVSDDGCGMDAETRSHLFEPFFTTKERGKGTGLGLATVFGIVQQNGGFLNVYSEPGQGTTFKIYLPRYRAAGALPASAPAAAAAPGSETVMLVEDEPAIRQVTLRMLERLGYAVLPAGAPQEALRLAREHTGRIDLLLSDVVMPEMNGRDLATKLLAVHPGMKRLFMSGYTANVIAHHGVLDEGVHFLQKPFTSAVLAAKLREVLEKP